jgi:hypothetical protein
MKVKTLLDRGLTRTFVLVAACEDVGGMDPCACQLMSQVEATYAMRAQLGGWWQLSDWERQVKKQWQRGVERFEGRIQIPSGLYRQCPSLLPCAEMHTHCTMRQPFHATPPRLGEKPLHTVRWPCASDPV